MTIDDLLARAAIHDLLCDYMRGQDRLDAMLHRSVFHDDATTDYGAFKGGPDAFVAYAQGALAGHRANHHMLGQAKIDVEGEVAFGEVYFQAFHRVVDAAGDEHDMWVSGRYVDRYERRAGTWKIAHRSELVDWLRIEPAADAALVAMGGWPMGARAPHDPSYDREGPANAMSNIEDRLAIMDLLWRYSRGVDRCDLATLTALWWPGGTADFGQGVLDARDWATALIPALKTMRGTQHMLGNMIIDLDGDRARAETYCRAQHDLDGPDGATVMIVGGRYLDTLEKRDGEWRLLARRYVMDWNSNAASTARDDGLYATLTRRGGRFPDDPLYTGA